MTQIMIKTNTYSHSKLSAARVHYAVKKAQNHVTLTFNLVA